MSGKVVGWAFDQGQDRTLSPTEKYVLVAYADNADRHGKCWPDKPEIMDKTGLSRATVYRAIGALEDRGHLRFTTDEKGRECVLLAVPWASHSETGESQSEISASQGEIRASHSETGSNKRTVKEPSGTVDGDDDPAGPTLTAVPDNLQPVLSVLDRTAFARNLPSPKVAATMAACNRYSDRALEAEAEKFHHYWTDGPGERRPLSDVAWSWRNWLERAKPATESSGSDPSNEDFSAYEQGVVHSG